MHRLVLRHLVAASALVLLAGYPSSAVADPGKTHTGVLRTKHLELRYRPGSRSGASVEAVADVAEGDFHAWQGAHPGFNGYDVAASCLLYLYDTYGAAKLGVNEPLEAIVFEGVLTQARLDYVDAVVNYNQAQVRLLRALGRAPVP